MDTQLFTFIAALGVACVLVAGFATDWRLGLALVGALAVFVSVRLEASRPPEPPEPSS